jgi:hypothetical protein
VGDLVEHGRLALRAAFRPNEVPGAPRAYELALDGAVLHLEVDRGEVTITSTPGPSDLSLRTTPATLVALLMGQQRVDDALSAGQLDVTGPKAEARRFFRIFRLDGP